MLTYPYRTIFFLLIHSRFSFVLASHGGQDLLIGFPVEVVLVDRQRAVTAGDQQSTGVIYECVHLLPDGGVEGKLRRLGLISTPPVAAATAFEEPVPVSLDTLKAFFIHGEIKKREKTA